MTKVGNILIENGNVYKVYKITVEEISSKSERILYYRPLSKKSGIESLECSIPENSLLVSNMRMLSSKAEIDNFFKTLSSNDFLSTEEIDTDNAIKLLALNNIQKTALVIKYYWKEIVKSNAVTTKTMRDVFEKSINSILDEVSLVTGETPEKTRVKIEKQLNKFFKIKPSESKTLN